MVGGRMTKRKFLRAMAAAGAGVAAGPLRAESGELIEAAEAGDEAFHARLVAQGAPVNLMDAKGRTALMAAASRSHVGVARALIDAGAEVRVANKAGRTPLMEAANRDDIDAVRLLIERGAEVNTRDKEGDSAWDLTTDEEIEQLLESHGAIRRESDDEPGGSEDDPRGVVS